MKKILFTFSLLLLLQAPVQTFAHDLLPAKIVEYLSDNPNATPEDIRAYAETLSPEISAQFSSKEEVIRLVRNQDTNALDNAWDFLVLGVKHILSGPDHILFVLSMLLVFGSLLELLKLTSTFTIAHSITLFLSGLGLVSLSPKIVEPIIALSIGFMAIATVFFGNHPLMRNNMGKIFLIFYFGLFHGFGFAGLLQEIAIPENRFMSSLFGFNIGIEIGQIIIIVLLLPFLLLFRNGPRYSLFTKFVALVISAFAFFWAGQRIFFS